MFGFNSADQEGTESFVCFKYQISEQWSRRTTYLDWIVQIKRVQNRKRVLIFGFQNTVFESGLNLITCISFLVQSCAQEPSFNLQFLELFM